MADKEKKSVAKAAAKAGKPAGKKEKKQKDHKVRRFFHDLKSEGKKIVWPKPRAVWKNVGVVVTMIVVLGLVIFGLDEAFSHLLHLFMDVAV